MFQKVWYEISPIVYLILAIYFLVGENKLAAFSGFVLLIVTLLIVAMRIQYRLKT
jgi:hypothetical protein